MSNDFNFKNTVGAWRVPENVKLSKHISTSSPYLLLSDLAFVIPDALSEKDCKILRDLFSKQKCSPVSVSGYQTSDVNKISVQSGVVSLEYESLYKNSLFTIHSERRLERNTSLSDMIFLHLSHLKVPSYL